MPNDNLISLALNNRDAIAYLLHCGTLKLELIQRAYASFLGCPPDEVDPLFAGDQNYLTFVYERFVCVGLADKILKDLYEGK